jgi:hypothetical protein
MGMANTIKKPLTQCGAYGHRARVVARDGSNVTYRWPCGYERTEVLTNGVGKLKRPMSPDMVAFFSRYWSDGVTYECPRCRRAAKKRPTHE